MKGQLWAYNLSKLKFSVYLTIIELSEGRHEYRYVVDGVDRHNPKEKTVENLFGGLNHVLRYESFFWRAAI
jgi:hypothetical protein